MSETKMCPSNLNKDPLVRLKTMNDAQNTSENSIERERRENEKFDLMLLRSREEIGSQIHDIHSDSAGSEKASSNSSHSRLSGQFSLLLKSDFNNKKTFVFEEMSQTGSQSKLKIQKGTSMVLGNSQVFSDFQTRFHSKLQLETNLISHYCKVYNVNENRIQHDIKHEREILCESRSFRCG